MLGEVVLKFDNLVFFKSISAEMRYDTNVCVKKNIGMFLIYWLTYQKHSQSMLSVTGGTNAHNVQKNLVEGSQAFETDCVGDSYDFIICFLQ